MYRSLFTAIQDAFKPIIYRKMLWKFSYVLVEMLTVKTFSVPLLNTVHQCIQALEFYTLFLFPSL